MVIVIQVIGVLTRVLVSGIGVLIIIGRSMVVLVIMGGTTVSVVLHQYTTIAVLATEPVSQLLLNVVTYRQVIDRVLVTKIAITDIVLMVAV